MTWNDKYLSTLPEITASADLDADIKYHTDCGDFAPRRYKTVPAPQRERTAVPAADVFHERLVRAPNRSSYCNITPEVPNGVSHGRFQQLLRGDLFQHIRLLGAPPPGVFSGIFTSIQEMRVFSLMAAHTVSFRIGMHFAVSDGRRLKAMGSLVKITRHEARIRFKSCYQMYPPHVTDWPLHGNLKQPKNVPRKQQWRSKQQRPYHKSNPVEYSSSYTAGAIASPREGSGSQTQEDSVSLSATNAISSSGFIISPETKWIAELAIAVEAAKPRIQDLENELANKPLQQKATHTEALVPSATNSALRKANGEMMSVAMRSIGKKFKGRKQKISALYKGNRKG
ncbi:hypothetical protein FB451DRAFT_1184453 [Mycena latifolia]|nr:hypothetical protein FB451DRAFT_1184453 [Mycena latifolia]